MTRSWFLLAPALLALVACASAQPLTSVTGPLHDELSELAARAGDRGRIVDLAASPAGRPVEGLLLGAAEWPAPGARGALVVAGLDGRRRQDGRLVLDVASELLARDDWSDLLGGQVLLFVPLVNPDAAAALAGVQGAAVEWVGNGRPTDADRDGRVDEDGPSDLDGDGQVTWMRVPDARGEWVVDEHDPRALRKAKRAEGERGTHRVLREGRDEDGDGHENEDGRDGVDLDRNFPHAWPEADAGAGTHPLGEPAPRALADLVLQHPGLHSVLVVGGADTLAETPGAAGNMPTQRSWTGGLRFTGPLDGLAEADHATMQELARRFDEAAEGSHEVKGEGAALAPGSLLAWSYHHAGRWPLGLRGWAPPTDLPAPEQEGDDAGSEAAGDAGDGADDGATDDGPDHGEAPGEDGVDDGETPAGDTEAAGDADGDPAPGDDSTPGDPSDPSDPSDLSGSAEGDEAEDDGPTSDPDSPVPAAILAWLDQDERPGFRPWTAFQHDQLGDVEIGGLLPGATLNGPGGEDHDALAARTASFLVELLAAVPALAFEDVEVRAVAPGAWSLEADLVNTGLLPTATELGAAAGITRPVRVTLELPDGTERVQGPPVSLVDRLEGAGGRTTLRWTLAGEGGVVRLAAESPTVSAIALEVTLP